jgi:hypothetical protein
MIQPTYNTVSGQGLLDSYKVHYSFDNYTQAAGSNFINSDAESFFSGKVHTLSTGPDTTDPFDYFTGSGQVTSQGVFSGGLNEFYSYITIEQSTGLNTGNENEFTFIIAAEATSTQDIGETYKGPVTNNNILFSNWSGADTNLYYGWQMGINGANRAYIETYDNLKPKTLTYANAKMPFSHNIWAFMHRGAELSVGLYDIKKESFIFTSSPIGSNSFYSGGMWNIGSGINYDGKTFTTQMPLNSGVFAGRMSDFIFFDNALSNEQASIVAKSLYSESYVKQAAVTETVISGFTGISSAQNNIEDEVGLFSTTSTQQENSNLNFSKKEPLTGNIESGDIHYQLIKTVAHEISGTEGIYKSVYHTGATITGVTGFTDVNYVSGISRSYELAADNSQLADVLTGLTYTNLTGSTYTATLSNVVSGISGYPTQLFRPNQLSFIDIQDEDSFFCEICRSDSFEIVNNGALNNAVNYQRSRQNDGRSIFLNHLTGTEDISLYVDGRGYEAGTLQSNENQARDVIVDDVNGQTYILTTSGLINIDVYDDESENFVNYYRNYNINSGDFVLSGLEVLDNHIWTGTRGTELNGIYDLYQPTGYLSGASRWVITGQQSFIDYPNSLFNSGDEGQFVFLNGQKLVSGIDYSNQFSDWSDYVSGESTGVLFLRPNISDFTLTGNSGNIDNQYYWPNSNLVYFNGIRQDYQRYFVENSHTKDLISGVKTVAKNTNTLYNN